MKEFEGKQLKWIISEDSDDNPKIVEKNAFLKAALRKIQKIQKGINPISGTDLQVYIREACRGNVRL